MKRPHARRALAERARAACVGSTTPKGYYAEDLSDAWARYCPPHPRRIRNIRNVRNTAGQRG